MWRYAPDVDPTTPEIYTAVTRMIPTPWGTYRTCPSMTSTGAGTSTNAPLNSAVMVKTDGTQRWVAGTAAKLYDSTDDGVTFTDRSGATYSASTGWQFGQFGDVTIAVTIGHATQASSSGSFADLTGSPPKAKCIAVQSNAVVLGHYNDGTLYTDGWWASDVASHTTWTGGESASGRLIQTPGPITALIAFQGRVIAFKANSVYEGQYVGGVVKWSWRLIHASIGCGNPEAVATDGDRLAFYGAAGAYIYDGASFTRIDAGVEKALNALLTTGASAVVTYSHDEKIFIFGGSPQLWFAYAPDAALWGKGGDANATAGALAQIFSRVPIGTSRRGFLGASGTYTAYKATGVVYTFSDSSVVTGWIGSDLQVTNINDVIPLFVPNGDYSYNNGHGTTYPARLTHKTAATRAATMASTAASPILLNLTTGKFNTNATARWHELTIADTGGAASGLEGGMELSGINIYSAKPSGRN